MKKLFLPLILAAMSISCAAITNTETTFATGTEDPAPVYFSPLPTELTFAGERVPLEFPDVCEALQRELSVTMYMHSRTLQTLRATTRYFPMIEKILKQHGVPNDFKYLCMAESSLNPNAMSSAKAAGLWQFMVSAAKDYGVETGDNVDMRYHVETATTAAAKYLKNAYERYGNWTMAAASYNAGLTGVTRRANTQGVDNYYDLFLPEETMRYVFRILSMKLVTEKPATYGFKLRKSDYLQPFVNYKTIEVNDQEIDWSELAAHYGTNYKVLRILNPWIRSYQYANKSRKTYEVMIPNSDFRIKGY